MATLKMLTSTYLNVTRLNSTPCISEISIQMTTSTVSQAVNFWKILVLNDEHTERKYVFYFLIGWGECRCMLGRGTQVHAG